MNILEILVQLRDDLKTWVTNNLNALNDKIDEKTIPIDNELSSTSTNPVQNKTITNAINNIPRFSGSYTDLTDAPNIAEDDSGNMIIADESGNIIFKADEGGIHTTALSLNGEPAATETYVNAAIAEIPTPDVSGQINAHNTSEAAHEDIRQAINNAKEELSESIVAESDEWKVVDNNGNIIFSVDADGAHTTAMSLNGDAVATEGWVENKNYLTEHQDISGKSDVGHKHVLEDITDLPNFATEDYVDNKVAGLVNSAPETLDTLGEIAAALENHEDAYDALLETVGGKATHTDLENLKEELSESITAEAEDWKVVDNSGNIIFSVDAIGAHTTNLTLNGESAATESYVDDAIDNIEFPTTDLTDYATKEYVDKAIGDIDFPETDFTGYATETYVNTKVADVVNSAPEALDTLGELAVALENHEDAYDALLETVGSKATRTDLENLKEELSESITAEAEDWKVVDSNGNIIFSVDNTGAHTTNLTLNGEEAATKTYVDEAVAAIEFPETDLSNYYTKEQTDTAINTVKEELSESIVAESDEWKVVDEAGNIIFSVDATGAHTTNLTLNGELLELLELITVEDIDNICSVTLEPEPEIFSEGLEYVLNSDNASYTLSGIGDCTDTDIVIPSKYNGLPVTSIGSRAFKYCDNLTSITIPDGVTSIADYTFGYCIGLTSITIPDSVTSIGSRAFEYCDNLTSITIPDSVTSIAHETFKGCTGLTSITIPNSVTNLAADVFTGCTNLANISVDAGNPVYHSASNCVIETASKTLVVGCKNSVIPSDGSVTSIGNNAFQGCTGLASITIPNSVTSISGGAFASCTGLTSISIPVTMIIINNNVFNGCKGLTSVRIPKSITTIGASAFGYCTSISEVYYSGNEAQWAAISIGSSNEYLTSAKIYYNIPMGGHSGGGGN